MDRAFWEARYAAGNDSGEGSRGKEGHNKAAFISQVIHHRGIVSVVDWGCGDGTLLAQMNLHEADYLGIDVSATAIAKCIKQWPAREWLLRDPGSLLHVGAVAELALSISVLWHLVDDDEYERYLQELFASADQFVLVYCSNVEQQCEAPHMRHRRWTDDVPERWEQIDCTAPDDDLWAEGFYLFGRAS